MHTSDMRAEKRYFEEVPVGETRTSYGRTITESDIHGFAGLEDTTVSYTQTKRTQKRHHMVAESLTAH